MRFRSMRPRFWPFPSQTPDETVLRDADELIAAWGVAAYDAAAKMSWREDIGLLTTGDPGHWSRVKREVGSRLGRQDDGPEADFGATSQRLTAAH